MINKTISAILRSKWLIEPTWAESQLPWVSGLLKGNMIQQSESIKVADASIYASGIYVNKYSSLEMFPQGSIAVIDISGPIMKHDGACGGAPGSMSYAELIKKVSANEKISGIVLQIDSPGGMVDGTATLADTIKNSPIPIVGFINDGMMASAAMWIGSATLEIYASQPTDTIGSIGVYTTIYDQKERLEANGIKVHEIYAPESTQKNKDYKDALAGDYKGIEEELSFIAQRFIDVIKTNRGELAIKNEKVWNAGKMFTAEKAKEIGLIDGIQTLEQTIARVEELSKKGNQTNKNNNNTTMGIFGKDFPKLEALKEKKAEEITAVELDAVNAELTEKGVTNVVITIPSILAAAKKDAETAKSANDTIASLTSDRDAWKTKAEEFGEQPGALGTGAKKEKDEPTEEEKNMKVIFDLPHYETVKNNPLFNN